MPKSKATYRVTLEDVIEAHNRALEFGGVQGVLSEPLIRSAIERPYSGYYRRIHKKAAALVESIAKNHGFADGNKRTAVLLLDLLLERSGYQLTVRDDNPDLEAIILDVATSAIDFDQLALWLKDHIVRKE